MGVYKLSAAGSVLTNRTEYKSMNAGNQYGAMVPIATATGTGSANIVTFSNIPQTYQDLMVVGYVNLTSTGQAWMYSNGYGAGGYSDTKLYGNGSSASSARDTSQTLWVIMDAGSIGTTYPATFVSHLLNYANTTTFKTVLTHTAADQNGSGTVQFTVAMKSSTAATTSLELNTFGAANFATSTIFTLYGIRAVSS